MTANHFWGWYNAMMLSLSSSSEGTFCFWTITLVLVIKLMDLFEILQAGLIPQ